MKNMEFVESIDCDCKLCDVLKLRGLEPGYLIHFCDKQVPPILIGDCTPYIRPTNNDGSIGWDWGSDYCNLKVKKIDVFKINRTSTPLDYRKLA